MKRKIEPLGIRNESTQQALAYTRRFTNRFGQPVEIVHIADYKRGEYLTQFRMLSGMEFQTTGFSSGYCGEGCHGLKDALKLCGMTVDIDTIAGLKEGTFAHVAFYPSTGKVVKGWFHDKKGKG